MDNKISIILKVLLAILLLLCLLDMQYFYFQFIRVFGMTCFAALAYLDRNKKNKVFVIIWICSAIIINPIIKVPLGRTIWNIVDVIWAVILLGSIFHHSMNSTKDNSPENI